MERYKVNYRENPTFIITFSERDRSIDAHFSFPAGRKPDACEVKAIEVIALEYQFCSERYLSKMINNQMLYSFKNEIEQIIHKANYSMGTSFELKDINFINEKYISKNYKEIQDEGYVIRIYDRGDREWRKNGVLHRDDGPAVETYDGTKIWLQNGQYHRLDGPAVEWPSGDKEWYIESKQIDCKTQEEFERLMRLKAFW